MCGLSVDLYCLKVFGVADSKHRTCTFAGLMPVLVFLVFGSWLLTSCRLWISVLLIFTT